MVSGSSESSLKSECADTAVAVIGVCLVMRTETALIRILSKVIIEKIQTNERKHDQDFQGLELGTMASSILTPAFPQPFPSITLSLHKLCPSSRQTPNSAHSSPPTGRSLLT